MITNMNRNLYTKVRFNFSNLKAMISIAMPKPGLLRKPGLFRLAISLP